ncbi:MAG: hypothetical protein OEX77_00680 [Candidatus Bathyarchaeota archaeon]|nr:hypothetical protein [Candidatus Bathyarchaeota archaeon]
MYINRFQIFLTLASIINFLCAYLLFFVWEQQYGYFIVIVLASFMIGIVIGDLREAIPYTFVAWITGSFISVGILLIPAVVYGAESFLLDAFILSYLTYLARLAFFVFPLSFGVTALGCYFSRGRTGIIKTS